jgi:hypothetical protein
VILVLTELEVVGPEVDRLNSDAEGAEVQAGQYGRVSDEIQLIRVAFGDAGRKGIPIRLRGCMTWARVGQVSPGLHRRPEAEFWERARRASADRASSRSRSIFLIRIRSQVKLTRPTMTTGRK